MSDSLTPWTAAHQASLSFTISQSLLKLMSIELVMPSNHLILCHPFLLSSIFPSIRGFSSELVLCIWWPRYWSFSFSISPSNEYSGLISFRTDWFYPLAVQGTLKSLLQYHSSKASIFSLLSSLWSDSQSGGRGPEGPKPIECTLTSRLSSPIILTMGGPVPLASLGSQPFRCGRTLGESLICVLCTFAHSPRPSFCLLTFPFLQFLLWAPHH